MPPERPKIGTKSQKANESENSGDEADIAEEDAQESRTGSVLMNVQVALKRTAITNDSWQGGLVKSLPTGQKASQ